MTKAYIAQQIVMFGLWCFLIWMGVLTAKEMCEQG